MNKIILTLLMTILFTPAANAQNCVNSSRCDELGYNKKAENCIDDDILKCPFDSNKVFCRTQEQPAATNCLNAKIGDILYSDKTCSSDYIAGKTPIAVVISTDKRLAIGLKAAAVTWVDESMNPSSSSVGAVGVQRIQKLRDCIPSSSESTISDSFGGKGYTSAIYKCCKEGNFTCPAISYAYEYQTPGTEAGDWFLPAGGEVSILHNNDYEQQEFLKNQYIKAGGIDFTAVDLWTCDKGTTNSLWGIWEAEIRTYKISYFLNFAVAPVEYVIPFLIY